MMGLLKTTGLFAITAVAEILGCYLPWLVLKQGRPPWLLLPAAVSLALFAWLLTLHPFAAGRTYAAYGGVYSRRGAGLAVGCGWRRADTLGRDRRGRGPGWHGDHRVAADERLIGPGATPCRAGAGRLPGPLR